MTDLLSDGQPVEVRQLKFLELDDHVPFLDPGLYIHNYVVDGHDQPVGYGLQDFGEIPDKPEAPFAEALPGSMEEALWSQYHLYRAVLTHEHKRADAREEYLVDSARYILSNCLTSEDRDRAVTPDDFKLIYRLALCPEVTEGDIVAVLATVFQGYMEGEALVGLIEETERVGGFLYSDSALGDEIDGRAWLKSSNIRASVSQ